jgi:hypothetical protein
VSDTLGGDYIYTVLSGALSAPAYNSRMVPETETSKTTVNFYPVGNYDASFEYFSIPWSIDCRAPTSNSSIELAIEVRDALNRETAVVGGYTYFGVIQIGGVIPPLDDADVYNTPVTLTVRRK